MNSWDNDLSKKLVKQIKSINLPEDILAVWYLGQEGFAFKYKDKVILIDAYLTDFADTIPGIDKDFWVRKYPSPLNPNMLNFVDYVICTHEHYDHMDPGTLKAIGAVNPRAIFIVPQPCCHSLISLGIDKNKIIGAKADVVINLDGIITTPIAAAHDVLHIDDNGNYKELSFHFDIFGFTFFHGGDMSFYEGLPEKLKQLPVNVAMLPINGSDWLRDSHEIVGNLNFREAVDLGAYMGAKYLIPMHFDLYDVNSENPSFFVDYVHRIYPNQKYHIFKPGEMMLFYREKFE